ncbi:MAG: hypothetical protein Q8P41_18975 [Pseudomonadota bacterium]|nr:hypothetical protein [Pseudomonadota bacterium]
MKRPLLLLQAAVLAVLFTWPLVPRFGAEAIGRIDTDTPKHLWTLWWMRQEVWDGTPGLLTRWANWPDGMRLYPIEPLNGIFAALIPLDPVPLSNLLALVHVVLIGVCAGWLGFEVSGTRIGAHVASALAQACAFTAFTLDLGTGELRQAWWIPLGLAVLVRARRTEDRRWFVTLAVVLAGAVLACFYHGLFLAIAVAIWALATLRVRRRLLTGYAMAAGLSLLVVVPIVRGFAGAYGGDDGAVTSGPGTSGPGTSGAGTSGAGTSGAGTSGAGGPAGFSVDRYTGASVSVEQLWTPAALPGVEGDARRRYDGGRYLGLVTLLLAGIGVAAAPRRAGPWVAVFGVCLVLSLGPVLIVQQAPLRVGNVVFGLPLAGLNDALGRIGEPVNFPARFLAPAMIALAVLGALATRWRWAWVLVPLAVVDSVTNDETPWPRETTVLPDMAGLAAAAGPGAVADVGMVGNAEPTARTRSIAAQLLLGRPFASVPIERLSAWSASGDRWLRALPLVRAANHLEGEATAPTEGNWRPDLWLLRDRGIDRVLLTHRTSGVDVRADTVLTPALGEPVRTAQATIWSVPAVEATEAEGEAWRAAQAERVAGPR